MFFPPPLDPTVASDRRTFNHVKPFARLAWVRIVLSILSTYKEVLPKKALPQESPLNVADKKKKPSSL